MKSIKTKLMLLTTGLISVIVVGMISLAITVASNSLQNTAESTMSAMVNQGAKVVESRVNWQLAVLETIAADDFLTDNKLSTNDKLKRLSTAIEKNGYIKMGISDLNGKIVFNNGTTTDIKQRDYYQKALEGQSYASDPLMSQTEGKIVVVYATPIVQSGKVVGVLTATKDGDEISNIVNDITFGQTGKAFMLNSAGVKIAHYNNELVTNMDNDLENVKNNGELVQLVELENKMINGESGTGMYKYDGKEKLLTFAPVASTSWSLAVTVEKSEVLSEVRNLVISGISLAIVFLIIAFVTMYFISNSIVKRIKLAIAYIIPISNGDFSNPIAEKHLKIKDEVGQMINALNTMQQSVKDMLSVIIDNSIKIDEDAQSLSAVSQQMSASSNVMANSIQEVALGTSSQSDSLASITESLSLFSNNIEHIATEIKAVDSSAKDIKTLSQSSNQNIKELAKSVKNTNESFGKFENGITNLGENINKINDITNLINQLSEQTNLLALNAAIEAARAGEAGKGFAVVADEIRRLAEQSKESSVTISALINEINVESSVMIDTSKNVSKEFAEQTEVISGTLDSFGHIVSAVEDIIPKIDTVNISVYNSNNEKNDIMSKVENISAISEETTASSEEISASTEEIAKSSEDVANSAVNLGSRIKDMMQEVSKFKL